jgi:HD-GYP domain-containing protein (c-di-GMP phosphodiesterase class II)
MRLVQMQASQLKPGMFVAEIDRPWLDTPFMLQGFVIQNEDDIDFVCQHVEWVSVDVEYRGSNIMLPQMGRSPAPPPRRDGLAIKTDFDQAKASFENATDVLEKTFASIKSGDLGDLKSVRKAVAPLIKGVFHNKDALAALTRLRASGEYLYNHSIGMSIWAAIVGRHIGLMADTLEKLVVGCAMCDLGMSLLPKGKIPDTGPLDAETRRLLLSHPILGADHLKKTGDADIEILGIIEYHHERHDGSGYPKGAKGAEIPLLARIAGLVDTYDAMINKRGYSVQRSSFEAVQELIDCSDTLFPRVLVEQFVQAIGMFPVGALIELNTGEVGVVVEQNPTRRLKPEVLLVLNADKTPKAHYDIVDLAESRLTDRNELWIVRELKAGSYGISSQDYFI